MKLKEKIEKIFDFSIVFVPGSAYAKIHSKMLNGKASVLYLLLSIVLLTLIVSAMWIYTPVRELMPNADSNFTPSELRMINQLNTKVNYLIKELDQLKNTNQRLKEIISRNDSINNLSPIDDGKEKIKGKGSVYLVFRVFIEKYFLDGDEITFKNPVNGYISKEFDPESGHYGIDYSLKPGSPVYASANGYIVFSGFTIDGGYMVIIAHKDEYLTIYKHCSSVVKGVREKVTQGEVIAFSGNTGKLSYGPHLHFEIWHRGSVINPKRVLMNY
ncbi:MAG: M23 family metallopeptidase [Ignavibacteriaceae bacterium]